MSQVPLETKCSGQASYVAKCNKRCTQHRRGTQGPTGHGEYNWRGVECNAGKRFSKFRGRDFKLSTGVGDVVRGSHCGQQERGKESRDGDRRGWWKLYGLIQGKIATEGLGRLVCGSQALQCNTNAKRTICLESP